MIQRRLKNESAAHQELYEQDLDEIKEALLKIEESILRLDHLDIQEMNSSSIDSEEKPKIFRSLIVWSILFFLAAETILNFFDFNQCSKVCKVQESVTNPKKIKGFRFFNKCICYQSNFVDRLYNNQKSYSKISNQVCGGDGKTYESLEILEANNQEKKETVHVLHSGFCGYCSNQHDIEIYNKTRQNLTEIATRCAKRVLISSKFAKNYFDEHVGFTEACRNCWIENMECTIAHCLKPCLKQVFINKLPNNKANKALNECLRCDEENCGTQFVKCAGVNRRKAGILTDIERPNDEVYQGN